MTNEYRTRELSEAKIHLIAARARLANAKTNKSIREADEDVTFWGNKVAFLGARESAK